MVKSGGRDRSRARARMGRGGIRVDYGDFARTCRCRRRRSHHQSLKKIVWTAVTPPLLRIARISTMAGSDNPFVNADAWRRHPLLNNTWRHIAPGFFIGLTAFGVFYAYDKATSKKPAKH